MHVENSMPMADRDHLPRGRPLPFPSALQGLLHGGHVHLRSHGRALRTLPPPGGAFGPGPAPRTARLLEHLPASVSIGPVREVSSDSPIRKTTWAFANTAASDGRRLKVCGVTAPRMIRWGSPRPAITALTSECSGLIVATTRTLVSAAAEPAIAAWNSTAIATAKVKRRGISFENIVIEVLCFMSNDNPYIRKTEHLDVLGDQSSCLRSR